MNAQAQYNYLEAVQQQIRIGMQQEDFHLQTYLETRKQDVVEWELNRRFGKYALTGAPTLERDALLCLKGNERFFMPACQAFAVGKAFFRYNPLQRDALLRSYMAIEAIKRIVLHHITTQRTLKKQRKQKFLPPRKEEENQQERTRKQKTA